MEYRTDEDFEQTVQLLRTVPFKNNFIFKYSPRPGTVSISRFPDDVRDEVKRARNNELLALQAEIGTEVHASWVGREVDVLVERITKKSPKPAVSAADARVTLGRGLGLLGGGSARPDRNSSALKDPPVQVSGRTPGDLITVFDLPSRDIATGCIGTIQRVRVDDSGPLLLRGTRVEA